MTEDCKCPFCEAGYPVRNLGTGRMSSQEPEIQRLPPPRIAIVGGSGISAAVYAELRKKLNDAYVQNSTLSNVDYSDLEARIVVLDSDEEFLERHYDVYEGMRGIPIIPDELIQEPAVRYKMQLREPTPEFDPGPKNRKQRRAMSSTKKGVSQHVGGSKSSNWNRKPKR